MTVKGKGGRPKNKPLNKEALKKAKAIVKAGDSKSTKRNLAKKFIKPYLEFMTYIDQVGFLNASPKQYAKENDLKTSTVKQWKDYYLEDYNINLTEISNALVSQNYAVVGRLATLAFSKDAKVGVAASKAFVDSTEKFITIIERLGFKRETKSHDEVQVVFNVGVAKLDYPVIDYLVEAEVIEDE